MKKEKTVIGKHLNLNIRGLTPSATLAINEKSNRMISEGREVYKLGLGQSPFPVPETVVEALRANAHQKDYLPVKGLPKLREAIASFNQRTQHVNSSPDDILIGPGSKELIFILQLVYYGDLIIPTPSWVSYSPQARIVGRHVNWVPTTVDNNWRLSPEKLDLICRSDPDRPRVVILNYPSNPTGCTYPVERLKLLAQVARKYGVILVSDEIYGLTHHNGQHVSVAHYYPEGTIISSGLSKWCGAGGWRLGCFTFPPSLRWLQDSMSIVASETYTATSAPIQHAAVTAFNGNEEIDNYLAHSRKILKGLAKFLVKQFESVGMAVPHPQGAFYLFPNFENFREQLNKQGIYTSKELCDRVLDDTGVAMLPGFDFGRQPEELTARIAYVNFDGRLAIDAVKAKEKDFLVDKNFIADYCPNTRIAAERLCNWLSDL